MRRYMTWMLITSMLGSPAATYGADSQASSQKPSEKLSLRNVQLAADGALHGQVLTSTGIPITQAAVTVHAQNNVKLIAADIKCDQDGRFTVTGLKNGACVLSVGEQTFAFRVWNHKTAPPNSLTSVALVSGNTVARGQNDGIIQRMRNKVASLTTTQKACLGLLIAAAIVIPIATDDDDDAS